MKPYFRKQKETKMKQEITLYHRRRDGKIKIWMCRQSGARVTQAWGEQDGKIQTTVHDVKGNDREGPVARAARRFNRLIEMRARKGYVTNLNQVQQTTTLTDTEIDFGRLPRKFAPAKPKKSIDLLMAAKWDKAGRLVIQRKRDGMRHRITCDAVGKYHIFSSSNADVTTELAPLLVGLRLPKRTILDAELVVTTHTGQDSFKTVSEIARSHAPKSHQKIFAAERVGMTVQFIVFDILYDEGQPIYKRPYLERYDRLRQLLGGSSVSSVIVMPITGKRLDESIRICKDLRWEGLVVWESDKPTIVRTNGSPERTNCWKIKFVKEADVIATGYELGKGRNAKVVGKLRIAEWSWTKNYPPGPTSTIFKPMGRCGTGLDDKTREEALRWTYPCVIQIEYDNKTDKGFRFPVFVRKRADKAVRDAR